MLDQSITVVSDIESHKREVREGQKNRKPKPVDKYTENEFVQQVQVEIEIQNFFKQLVIMYIQRRSYWIFRGQIYIFRRPIVC